MANDGDQLSNSTQSSQNDDQQQDDVQNGQTQNDLEAAVEELMQDFDLDPEQAQKMRQLEDAGYDEEDALSQAMDS